MEQCYQLQVTSTRSLSFTSSERYNYIGTIELKLRKAINDCVIGITMTSRYKDHLFGAMSHCFILCNLLTKIWWSTRGQMCKSNKSIGRFLGIQPDNNTVYEPFWTVSEHIVAPAVKTLAPPWSRQSHLRGGQTVPCWRTSWRTSLQTYKMLKLGSRQDSHCHKDQFNWWINWRGPDYPTIVSLQDCHHKDNKNEFVASAFFEVQQNHPCIHLQ